MTRRITITEEKPKYIPTDQPGLIRDTESGAILVTDRKALARHRKLREQQKETKAKLESINSLQDQVAELQAQMKKLLAKD